MEKELFDWTKWDGDANEWMTFIKCTLKVQVGEHKPGKQVAIISVNFQEGKMQLFLNETDDSPAEEYKLLLSIGEKI